VRVYTEHPKLLLRLPINATNYYDLMLFIQYGNPNPKCTIK